MTELGVGEWIVLVSELDGEIWFDFGTMEYPVVSEKMASDGQAASMARLAHGVLNAVGGKGIAVSFSVDGDLPAVRAAIEEFGGEKMAKLSRAERRRLFSGH